MGELADHAVRIDPRAFVAYPFLIPSMTGVLATDLRVRRAEISHYRPEIAAALDCLFLRV